MIINSEYLYAYISTGDKTALYTLRVMSDDLVQLGYEKRIIRNSHFIQILSNDKDKASRKGRELAEELGVPFKDNADFDLKEIKRQRDALSQEKRLAYEKALEEKAQRERQIVEEQIKNNVFLIGKYAGETPEYVNQENQPYLFWMATNHDANGLLGVSGKIASKFIEDYDITPPDYLGKEGDIIQLKVKINDSFAVQGIYGTQWLFKTRDVETGSSVIFYTTSQKFLDKKVGDVVELSGVVKTHQEDKVGLKNTLLSSIKYIPSAEELAQKNSKKKTKIPKIKP
jgi:hypothetical protein